MPCQRGLRPTSDRVRETLFNWLAPNIADSRCLDCFAGSGALGFEAFSRGAAEVVLVERVAAVAARLRDNAVLLGMVPGGPGGRLDARLTVIGADVLRWLAMTKPAPFDIVFLDPPFAKPVIARACELLQRGWLASGALIYLETPVTEPPTLPAVWELLRECSAGQVRYALARAESG